jgi:4-hydroxy-3-methylbut-2-enyl diphosphate reductase
VHHVQTDADVRAEWVAGAEVVGLTAGTSTPDEVIDRVEARIRQVGAQIEAKPRSVGEELR